MFGQLSYRLLYITRLYRGFISHLYIAVLYRIIITPLYRAFIPCSNITFFLRSIIFNPYYLITDMGVCKVFFRPLRLPAPVHSGPLVPKRLAAQLFPLVFISTCYIIFYKTFVKKPLK